MAREKGLYHVPVTKSGTHSDIYTLKYANKRFSTTASFEKGVKCGPAWVLNLQTQSEDR
jgi:hypothetical protein